MRLKYLKMGLSLELQERNPIRPRHSTCRLFGNALSRKSEKAQLYSGVPSPLLGENGIMHYFDSLQCVTLSPRASTGLPRKCEISERVLFRITFKLQLIR